MNRQDIFESINAERKRQNMLHPQWRGDHHGLSVLMEEVGEASKALYEMSEAHVERPYKFWKSNLKDELIQVASVCCRWLENMNDEA